MNVFVSFLGHTLALAIFILIPLLYTQSFNPSKFQTTYLVAPPPPPPPPPAPSVAPPHPVVHLRETKLFAPTVIPKNIAQIKEEPRPPGPVLSGVPGGVPGGIPGGQLGGVLGGILSATNRVPPPPPPPKPSAHKGPYRVGGNIQAPRLIREVQPVYPILARETKTSGKVVIDSVIDENGDVTKMKVISGNPLLISAAMTALEQWKYQPTLLNGKPISVDMNVTVDFTLSGQPS